MKQFLKSQIKNVFARNGYQISRIPLVEPNPQILGSFQDGLFILCNFCGMLFRRISGFHSEYLECPFCGAIARERVVFQCILSEISHRTGNTPLFVSQTAELKSLRVLECSPRFNAQRRAIMHASFAQYLTSDFDMSGHPADVKLDLTDYQEIAPYLGSLDLIICAHVLEHVPDYRRALEHLNSMLAPGGLLVLQVPIHQATYNTGSENEFHEDNTRVYHHFGFDLLEDLDRYFSGVKAVVGQLDFQISSPEIKPDKYAFLENNRERCILLGDQVVRLFGLGIADLCEAFIAYNK